MLRQSSFRVLGLHQFVLIAGLYLASAYITLADSGHSLDPVAPMPSLRLSSDAGSGAYRGQLVQLSLELHVPPSFPSEHQLILSIPWFGREFGFRWRMPPEQWLCQYSIAKPGSLPCRIDIPDELAYQLGIVRRLVTIYIPPDPTVAKTWKLTWQVILDKPILGNRISFAEISLQIPGTNRTVFSNALSLDMKEMLPPLSLQSACMLPPGAYTISAACEPSVAYVGEAIDYIVCISGSGALEDIDLGQIHRLLTRDLRLAVRFQGETWHDRRTRCLRWRLQLTSAGLWQLSSLHFLALDPLAEQPNYREILTNPVLIRALPALAAPPQEWAPDRPRLPMQKISHLTPPIGPRAATPCIPLILWLSPPALWWTLAILRWLRGRPLSCRRYSVPARKLFGVLKTQNCAATINSYTVWHALQRYLHERFSIDLGTSAQQIATSLSQLGLDQNLLCTLGSLLQRVEKAAFSPTAALNQADIQQLISYLTELENRLEQMTTIRC